MTVDLLVFVRARLAEDEATARAAGGDGPAGRWSIAHGARIEDGDLDVVVYDEGHPDEDQAEHIVRWQPARVLADVAATRALLDWLDTNDHVLGGRAALVIGRIALRWRDHPEWIVPERE